MELNLDWSCVVLRVVHLEHVGTERKALADLRVVDNRRRVRVYAGLISLHPKHLRQRGILKQRAIGCLVTSLHCAELVQQADFPPSDSLRIVDAKVYLDRQGLRLQLVRTEWEVHHVVSIQPK